MTDFTNEQFTTIADDLEQAVINLSLTDMAKIMHHDLSNDISYLTCCEKESDVKGDSERLIFLFNYSVYDVSSKSIYQSNIEYIKDTYSKVFKNYFTEDTLTSDCTGIMLYLDRLIDDILTHTITDDQLDDIDMLTYDLQSANDYPALNEDRMSEIETEDFHEAWKEYGKSDFISEIEKGINKLIALQGYDNKHKVWLSDNIDKCEDRLIYELFRAISDKVNGGEDFIIESCGIYINIPSSDKIAENKHILKDHLVCLLALVDKEDLDFMLAAINQQQLTSVV